MKNKNMVTIFFVVSISTTPTLLLSSKKRSENQHTFTQEQLKQALANVTTKQPKVLPLKTQPKPIPAKGDDDELQQQDKSQEIQKNVDKEVEKIVQNPQLFNTQFLKNRNAVRQELILKENFSERVIRLPGKPWFAMLYKIKPSAQYSLVCFGGWGQSKEFLAPLYELFKDQPCNIFLCEGRNVNRNIVKNFWDFGIKSDQDVIDSIQMAHQLSKGRPLVVWGTCAGAFYAARALVELTQKNKMALYNVAGFIFDSGWSAVDEAIITQARGRIRERIARTIAAWTGAKDYRKTGESWLAQGLTTVANWFINTVSWYVVKPLFGYRTYQTNLLKTLSSLTIPIFFIHSYDDWTKPISDTKRLYETAKNKTAWWIEFPSAHAMHHFKHKDEYKRRCIEFVKTKVLKRET